MKTLAATFQRNDKFWFQFKKNEMLLLVLQSNLPCFGFAYSRNKECIQAFPVIALEHNRVNAVAFDPVNLEVNQVQ